MSQKDLKFDYTVRDNYLLFWNGHFSNWYPATFSVDNITFNCAEQYMMYMKAKTFGDAVSADLILQAKDPMVQKKLGRSVANFNEAEWDKVKENIVFNACFAKYSQNSDLFTELVNTKELILVEASPYDKIWGIGMAADHPDATNESKWQGQNLLGKALMKVRGILNLLALEEGSE